MEFYLLFLEWELLIHFNVKIYLLLGVFVSRVVYSISFKTNVSCVRSAIIPPWHPIPHVPYSLSSFQCTNHEPDNPRTPEPRTQSKYIQPDVIHWEVEGFSSTCTYCSRFVTCWFTEDFMDQLGPGFASYLYKTGVKNDNFSHIFKKLSKAAF